MKKRGVSSKLKIEKSVAHSRHLSRIRILVLILVLIILLFLVLTYVGR
ncbi:hypothetical protein J4403_02950 [Candidatus Woesearchaeota archaeon]|nr:hypothetical protein [Candidatus Woesearchaeota archaeon]